MRKLVSAVCIIGFAGLMLVNVAQIAKACGACVVGWDSNHPPYTTCQRCSLAGSDEVFGYDLNTRGSSANNGDANGNWTLYQSLAHPTPSHVYDVSVDKPTTTIHEDSGIKEYSVVTHCQGKLNSAYTSGYADLSAWDDSCFSCSGTQRVEIRRHDQTACP